MSVNKVIILGNLGKEPEIRRTSDGKAVANLNIATTESWKDKSGQRQKKTEWHKVVVWGQSAETAEKYLKKGDSVYIEGKLETRKWQDSNGNDKYTTEIVVDMKGTMQMLGSRTEEKKVEPEKVESDPFNDSIPF